MPAGTAERRCAAIVAELDIPEPFDLGQFLARLVLQRNKMIYLHPFTSGPGVPSGLWIGTAEPDHVFHEEGTTPWESSSDVSLGEAGYWRSSEWKAPLQLGTIRSCGRRFPSQGLVTDLAIWPSCGWFL